MDTSTRWSRGRSLVAAIMALCLGLAGVACGDDDDGSAGGGDGDTTSARIGVVEVAEVPIFDTYVEGFRKGFLSTSGVSADNLELDVKNAQGDKSLIQNYARDLPREDYDLFAAIGTPVAIALGEAERERPIISIAMTDPVGAGVAKSLERPGGNVTGTTSTIPPEDAARFVANMSPAPQRVGTIYDPSNEASASFAEGLREELPKSGLELVEASISGAGDVASAARSLVGRVDVLLLGADALATGAGLPAIAEQARRRKVPLIIAAGVDPDTPGATAVIAPPNERLGELAGEQAGRIFAGKAEPATTPFVTLEPSIAVNERAASELGVSFDQTG
jgi:putative tryptophan/tyrosine transport system substrate-binding protein